MSDEETRQLYKDLESLQETLEAGTPAQIPLLDDIVDEEELRRHAPPRRKRTPRNNHQTRLQPPETGDLFDQPERDDEPQPANAEEENRPPETPMAPEKAATRQDDDQLEPVRYARAEPDTEPPAPDTRDILKARADRMVEDLVAEYSSEIIGRLKSELTERLYAILEDLDIEPDDDSRS
ncbi:MAG: hypothetical protein HUJ31_08320 [Pseudomonadales bacterium]|nr:hypothetical protein [Pseudomonadales bacterium]